jgi:hypothetical protein
MGQVATYKVWEMHGNQTFQRNIFSFVESTRLKRIFLKLLALVFALRITSLPVNEERARVLYPDF